MGKTIYVDDDAAGANNGSSWENAYVYLQDALADANSAEKPIEIRVAQGIYLPDLGAVQTLGDREATFQLINGVTLRGGYAGFGKPDPNARDVELYETILSGDLNGDDVQVDDPFDLNDEPTRSENSYNVVTGSSADGTTVIEGFTISAGNANLFAHNNGGGLFNQYGTPRIGNCAFKENSAWHGGGMDNIGNRSPVLTNCIFSRNEAHYGGGMHNGGIHSNPVLINCTFISNAASNGGGMDNWDGSPILIDCTFSTNRSGLGGGMRNDYDGNPVLINCTFTENSARYGGGMMNERNSNSKLSNCTFIANLADYGGGMSNFNSCPTLTGCKLSVNSADFYGGAMYNNASNLTLANCIFIGNTARIYGGILSSNHSNLTLINNTFCRNLSTSGSVLACNSRAQKEPSTIMIISCIIWGSDNEIWNYDGSSITISYSDIQNGQAGIYDPYSVVVWGQGNINAEPLFTSAGYWDPNNTPNDPSDDFWVDGDYHLKSQVGRWDPVSESWIIDDATSPCIDAGNPNSPVAFEPFPNGGIINMGAYGGTAEAGKSPSGIHAKYGGGTGEPNDPYLIYTAGQMNTIGAEPNDWDRHFKLMADIDLKDFGDSSFNLIGSDSYPFKGLFDGDGHTISNLTYTVTGDEEPAEDDVIMHFGLFRHIDDPNAVIKDLSLLNPDILPASTCQKRLFYVGALAGSLGSGSIRNCSIEGGQVQGERLVGGLAGWNKGTISDCYTTCTVGQAEQRLLPPIIEQLDRRESFGGLVGYNSYGEISNCHATGKVFGEWSIGGLVGETYGVISNSRSSGDVSGDTSVGGLVGWSGRKSRLSQCYATGHVSGRSNLGGLVGSSSKECNIDTCYATGSVSAEDNAGGLVGWHEGDISSCYATGLVLADADHAGGLVGLNGGTIRMSCAHGHVSGKNRIGGLVGFNLKEDIFLNSDPVVIDSYAKGSVYGEDYVGGLVGSNQGGAVLRCYSTGRVTGATDGSWLGGLVAINRDIPVENSFWDTVTCGLNTSSGGTGKTTTEMQTASTFLNAGWDFVDETANGTEDIWWILEGRDYPRLWWEAE
jgi:hypothetical protein